MSPFALLLVVAAAVVHASWNLAAKRVPSKLPFVWTFTVLSAAIYAPLVLWVVFARQGMANGVLLVGTVSAGLHSGYFLMLQHAYGNGDLSVVYPVARGGGAFLAGVGAVLLFGERPSGVGLAGAGLIVAGVFLLADPRAVRRAGAAAAGVWLALATGGVIACYTLWDGRAIRDLLVSPLVLTWVSDVGRAALLAPLALGNRDGLRVVWANHRREAFAVALLSPLAYLLVLSALALAPIAGVASAREVSVLLGVLLGVRVLGEPGSGRRVAAGALIAVGLVVLALAGGAG